MFGMTSERLINADRPAVSKESVPLVVSSASARRLALLDVGNGCVASSASDLVRT